MKKQSMQVRVEGSLLEAIEDLRGELEGRPDVFEVMTGAEVARRLIAHAVREHMAGRGPWQK